MKKGFEGENVAFILIAIIILSTVFFLVYTVFTGNYSLKNNDTIVNLDKNGESQTPSNINSNTSSNSEDNNNSDNPHKPSEKEIDELNINKDTVVSKEQDIPKNPEQIATYTTTIYDSDQNRIDNIKLAISKLNGAIIKAGEEFSFNTTIGPMDETQGFKKALGFDGEGNKIDIPGGGICQISSTLYNSVLIANLEVTERHPHSHRVYYVPQDKDATIFYGTYDLKFKNTTDRDIKIEATTDTANVTVNLIKI